MTYKLAFNESALKEWKKLGHTIQEQFKKKLRERLENPRVPASQLHGRKDQYKMKSVPVMAAGGITDSRTARAAHALGAEGVFAGSVFIGTEESRVPQSVKDKIINANGLDLLLFRTLPDYYRSLPGKLADKLVSMDKAGASNEELAQTMGGLRGLRIGMLEGNTDEGYIALGTGIGNIRSIKSVAEVVNELAIC